MTCKDCYHFDVCNLILKNALSCDNNDCSQECPLFKDKSRIVELPCKVGDTLYTNMSVSGWYLRDKDRPYPVKVVFVGINGVDNLYNTEYSEGKMWQFRGSDIGKTVFLTKEAAEQALRERENNA